VNPLAAYISRVLDELLAKHRIVVFYDPRREYEPYFDRDLEKVGGGDGIENVFVNERLTALARFDGSFFGLRAVIEPVVGRDEPGFLVAYVPGQEPDPKSSVLM
jgi:hypothetical protein